MAINNLQQKHGTANTRRECTCNVDITSPNGEWGPVWNKSNKKMGLGEGKPTWDPFASCLAKKA